MFTEKCGTSWQLVNKVLKKEKSTRMNCLLYMGCHEVKMKRFHLISFQVVFPLGVTGSCMHQRLRHEAEEEEQ